MTKDIYSKMEKYSILQKGAKCRIDSLIKITSLNHLNPIKAVMQYHLKQYITTKDIGIVKINKYNPLAAVWSLYGLLNHLTI